MPVAIHQARFNRFTRRPAADPGRMTGFLLPVTAVLIRALIAAFSAAVPTSTGTFRYFSAAPTGKYATPPASSSGYARQFQDVKSSGAAQARRNKDHALRIDVVDGLDDIFIRAVKRG
jgi:hypothetical protein